MRRLVHPCAELLCCLHKRADDSLNVQITITATNQLFSPQTRGFALKREAVETQGASVPLFYVLSHCSKSERGLDAHS